MKTNMNTSTNLKLFARSILILMLSFLALRCQDDIKEWKPKSNELVITDYVYSQPELFSEFGGVLKYTGIENLLRIRGPFTLLLPTNTAMQEYYIRMNVSSYEELDMKVLEDLVFNHVFQGEITAGSIGLGTLPYENGLGDYVASDLPGSDILLNKKAIIIKRDIHTANGIVHHIDYALEPITRSVLDIMAEYSGYSIFIQGLERAGLADTLKILNFPYGNIIARTRFTVLAVPDTLFNRYGIYTVDDLIAKYSTSEDLTDEENGFYQFMEYHLLSGTYYFSDFTTGPSGDIYYLISNNNYLNIKVEEDFKINKTDTAYTGFYYDLYNIPAKNGTIHSVNTLLPNEDTELAIITHQTTDYFDLHQGDYYLDHYQRFYDGQNTFEYIKWEAEFLQYYLKIGHNLMDDDAINVMGHFKVEITTPKIRKGKYQLSTFMNFGGGGDEVFACYVDDVFLGQINLSDGAWAGPALPVGEVEFKETKAHRIRLESMVPGGLWWDYVRFTPIE